ncbi:MAG: Na+/H+ antiporter NhaA [Candidatus Nanopelagicaceae bacterium]|nr:Na+/H+ antiporter NhaA [Candidatus Nanopelagicaceae bacterium]
MIRNIAPLRDFLHRESASGILILIASFLGLTVANSPLGDGYRSALAVDFRLGIDELYINLTLLKTINYILMTIFFFVVGLEIKRELTSGHLASFKKAIMPFVAALGGMAVPALIYLLIAGDIEPNGWGVPVATDIALAVGLLALVGTNAVASLRSFLLALAVIDDIGAILIIALVYSTGVEISWVLATFFMVFWIFAFKKMGAERIWIYILLGVTLWYCMYKSGVHPTLAGVVMGLMTPNQPKKDSGLMDSEDGSVSVIEFLESKLHPWSSFVIVPIFAFANTGVEISSSSISAAIESPIAWGIFFGLVVGKPIGVSLSSYLAGKAKLGEFPESARNIDVLATGSAAGIGFTVAIFIANLAFDSPAIQQLAVFSVIVASVVSGLISYTTFKLLGRKTNS